MSEYAPSGVVVPVPGASGFLSKERTIADSSFNRWLVPPAALAIHLCIGMAYGFSVFWLPLTRAVGVNAPVSCPADMSFIAQVFATGCDWKISMLGWIYTLFFVLLGSSAAIWGSWLEHAGPRKAGIVSAFCWCGGMVISALGVYFHQIWMLWLGSGVIGGIGLGLGYISPVSTLIKWFPDRRGLATGLAIMGFGGGAMIGAPLADLLIKHYASSTTTGVWETMLTLAAVYFIFMVGGALGYRVPPSGWKPANWQGPAAAKTDLVTQGHVHVRMAPRTPQFWLIWGALCLNVTAGIGVIGMASPMLQEVFGPKLISATVKVQEITSAQKGEIAAVAAGFVGLLSLFNIGGRLFWASLSDALGRKRTYATFFVLGTIAYASVPSAAHLNSAAVFAALVCISISMYGGGFSTVPAYLADIFGTQMVGAIHGRLLTAWSAAGILGPVLVNYLREYQLARGMAPTSVYDTTMYILAGLLVVGFICNLLVRPVAPRYFMSETELAAERRLSHDVGRPSRSSIDNGAATARSRLLLFPAWIVVGVPLCWGVWTTISKALLLFR